MRNKFIDYSIFNIVNSIISQNNELDRIVEELLIVILNKFKSKYVGIYIKHCFKDEVIKFNKTISKKNSDVNIVLNKNILNDIVDKKEIIHNKLGYILPLFFGDISIGVLHIFYAKNRISFSKSEIKFLKDLSAHIAQVFISLGSVENIILKKSDGNKKLIKGVGVSKGISWGKIFNPKSQQDIIIKRNKKDFVNFEYESNLVKMAINKTIKEIKNLEKEIIESAGEDLANIFVFHQTILKDDKLLNDIENILKNKKIVAEYGVVEYFNILKNKFEGVNNHIIIDITDIEIQILNFIQQKGKLQVFSLPEEDFIFVAKQILPSDIIKTKSVHFKGMLEAGGGPTSHASILAKSLNIPLIYGVGENINQLKENQNVIVDSGSGIIINTPSKTIIREYQLLQKEAMKVKKSLIDGLTINTDTMDGYNIKIGANIGILSEVPFVSEYKAQYVGLYRTEMPFLIRQNFPSEEEQYKIYKKVIGNSKISTTIRTLDIGGDKAPKYLNMSAENNPVLGKRSIRIMFDLQKEFKSQIKAIYRAAIIGETKIMFPMVSSIEEVEKLREIVNEALLELTKSGINYSKNVQFGVMIEVPAAVWIIEDILKHVDFVSVGTNDLIQYTIAVDRDNNDVFHLFKPLHPAILKSLKKISNACEKENKDVFVCGEMASEPISLSVLIGLGFKNLSMSVHAIPQAKEFVKKISYKKMVRITNTILKMNNANEIEEYLLDKLSKYL